MNCKQAKGKLALLIGNDLDPSGMHDVQKHLGECTGCRDHLQQLSSCLEALQVPAKGSLGADGESLWPRISIKLASPNAGQKPHRLNGWAPTLAVAAACTAMLWVASQQFTGKVSTFMVPSQAVTEPADEAVTPRDNSEIDSPRPYDRERVKMPNGKSIQVTPVNERR